MRRIAFAFFVFSFYFLVADAAVACVCELPNRNLSVEEARVALVKSLDEATAVFTGQVVALDTFTVRFKVENVWKGEIQDDLIMSTGAKMNDDNTSTSSSCDYRFEKGEKCIVYAYGIGKEMQVHKCTRTRLLIHASKELKELDELAPREVENQELH